MTQDRVIKIIKVWFHCLIHWHRMGCTKTVRHTYDYCADCDYGCDDDFIKVIKNIWKGKYDEPNGDA